MTTRHTVRAFDEALAEVRRDVLTMGQLTRDQLTAAISLLGNIGLGGTGPNSTGLDDARVADPDAIETADEQVDDLEEKIEREVQRILVLRQPMADDLRSLLSCDRIATDLERIADHAKNIAHRATRIREHDGLPLDLSLTRRLADRVLKQVDGVLAAIAAGDAAAARAIWQQDEAIDRLFHDTFNRHLETLCQAPATATGCTHALFIAKALERIGDHCTNIAEDLVYWLTAERLRKRHVSAE